MLKKYSLLPLLLFMSFLISDCSATFKSQQRKRVGKKLYTEIAKSGLPWQVPAESHEGRQIYLLELGEGDSTTLIFGGFHGSEHSGVQLVFRFAEYLYNEQLSDLSSRVIIVPVLNPDGLLKTTRTNARGVDINRNFPTQNWRSEHKSKKNFPGVSPGSEKETEIAIALVETYKPQRIISVHAPLKTVNYDGPALTLARAMAKQNGYPVDSDIGYATPGSFGTFAGKEKGIPTITLELPRDSFDIIWQENRAALLEAIKY
jgi:protein MpaA